ncbi:hypothetical protein [Paludibaculum fermentans]|uniref:Uncharacterized protein n=1 Tax=Paludibaculum fermentans TaxID=1473598 RepID=A0A7S7SIF7_PALFE|nr:hypothetical protein [Paludibaculum fermentans]QOY84895.1 hypothetical protein IRI77_18710 [Paludibaculum fermentans]
MDPTSPLDWRTQAWLLSALIFNLPFYFRYGGDLWMEWPLPQYSLLLGVVALLVAVVFFFLPALAMHTSRKPLFETLAASIGTFPAEAVRGCGAVLLICYLSEFLGLLRWLLSQAWRLEAFNWTFECLIAGILGFLCFTGLQGETAAARMAWVSTRLGVAILLAALIRVHDGWPAIPGGFPDYTGQSAGMVLWRGLSGIALYVAPLAFFAAGWSSRGAGRKQVMATAFVGLALPLFTALLLVGISNVAVHSSPYYRYGGNPSIALALWGGAAQSAVAGRMLLAGLTFFGLARFCIRALADSAAFFSRKRAAQWWMTATAIALLTGLSRYNFDQRLIHTRVATTYVLVAASAILTSDWVLKRPQAEGRHRLDWVSCAALVAGLAAPWYLPTVIVGTGQDAWGYQSLLPSYAMALLTCLLGRLAERALLARRGDTAVAVSL